MSSNTDSNNIEKRSKGYYADPRSPIASTPLKKRKKQTPTVSESNNDENENAARKLPMDPVVEGDETKLASSPAVIPLQENSSRIDLDTSNTSSHGNWGGRVVSLFSPVLRFFGDTSHDSIIKDDDHHEQPSPTSPSSLNISSILPEEEEVVETHHEDVTLEDTPAATSTSADLNSSEEYEFCPFTYMKSLPSYDEVRIPNREIVLPKPSSDNESRLLLVLDLDETLVHCTVDAIESADLKFPVSYAGEEYMIHARKRPHMEAFLEAVAEKFEVAVFTASQQAYAEALLDLLDPSSKWIHHRLYRDSCLPVDGNFLKDLNVLGRDLSRVVLVDNSPHAFGYQVSNGIPIESWFGDTSDEELLKLLPFLESLMSVSDVRPVLTNQFQIQERIDQAVDLEESVKSSLN